MLETLAIAAGLLFGGYALLQVAALFDTTEEGRLYARGEITESDYLFSKTRSAKGLLFLMFALPAWSLHILLVAFLVVRAFRWLSSAVS